MSLRPIWEWISVLELRNVVAGYGKSTVLHEVSLEIGEKDIVTLIGANGAGKSTMLMTICGVVPVRSGEILFEGVPISGKTPDAIAKMGISQVPEGRRIFPAMTVKENLDMGALTRQDKNGVGRDLDYVYELFPRLKERKNQLGRTLSGGEQQMLAIGRAIMAHPRLLLMDEPSLGLAPLFVQQIFQIIQRINRDSHTTIFLLEQNAYLALRTASRGYVLETGQITMADTGKNLLENKAIRTAYLGE